MRIVCTSCQSGTIRQVSLVLLPPDFPPQVLFKLFKATIISGYLTNLALRYLNAKLSAR